MTSTAPLRVLLMLSPVLRRDPPRPRSARSTPARSPQPRPPVSPGPGPDGPSVGTIARSSPTAACHRHTAPVDPPRPPRPRMHRPAPPTITMGRPVRHGMLLCCVWIAIPVGTRKRLDTPHTGVQADSPRKCTDESHPPSSLGVRATSPKRMLDAVCEPYARAPGVSSRSPRTRRRAARTSRAGEPSVRAPTGGRPRARARFPQ